MKSQQKVLICGDSFKNISGLSYVSLSLAKFFIQKNYEVAYCILSGADCTSKDLINKGHFFYENLIDLKVYNCQNKKDGSLQLFNNCIKDHKPTIVLSVHDLWQFENIYVSAYRDTYTWISYCPIESAYYSEYIVNPTKTDNNIRKSLSALCENMDYAIAYNNVGKSQLAKFKSSVTDSLPNGLDDFYFDESEIDRQVMFKGVAKEDDFIFMSTGHNFNRKGLDYVVDAFYKFLKANSMNKKYKLYLHGYLDTIDAGTDIKSMIYEMGISDYVIMSQDNTKTPKRELYKRYRCCDAYIGLPLAEGFGYGFFEAMQSGLPIIYHNVGGIQQYLKSSVSYPIDSVATMRPNNYFCEWKIPGVDQAVQAMIKVSQFSKEELEDIKVNNMKQSKKYLWSEVYKQLEVIIDFDTVGKTGIFNKLNIKRMA